MIPHVDQVHTLEDKVRIRLAMEYWVFNPENANNFEAARDALSVRGMEQYITDNWSKGLTYVKAGMRI